MVNAEEKNIRYLSLFSGIEAATVAWEYLGWEPMAFSEIDPFPSAVLAYRFPGVPNLGDITKVDWGDFLERSGRPDVVVGGSPCTSFSIAGGRESLRGESRLMFEYVRAVGELRPEWFIWENVPGCLNTRDNAFGQLLHEMENVGYKDIAWRVLDSQFARVPMRDCDGRITGWFGPVAQRRRRVFLVGHLGDGGFASAAVLFEPEGLRRNPTASKQKREALARDAESGVGEAGTRNTNMSYAIRTSNTKANGCGIQPEVAHTIDAAGPEAIAFAQNQRDEVRLIGGKGDVASSLSATQFGTHKNETLICMSSGQANAEIEVDDVSPTLTNLHEQPIVCMADDTQNSAIDVDVSGTLKCGGGIPFIVTSR